METYRNIMYSGLHVFCNCGSNYLLLYYYQIILILTYQFRASLHHKMASDTKFSGMANITNNIYSKIILYGVPFNIFSLPAGHSLLKDVIFPASD